MIEIRHNKKFPRQEAVPEKPGIYSWFYDFEKLVEIISDKESLIEEMIEISKKLCSPPLQGDLNGHLGSKYEANMENVDFISLEDNQTSILIEMDEKELKDILDILNGLSPPVYIGITKNLKQRYNEHLNDYIKAKSSADKEIKETFGKRLFKMGLEPRELVFKYEISENVDRKNIQLLEYIANRLLKPIAGRR